MDFDEDLEKFRSNLTQVSNKFVEEWTGEELNHFTVEQSMMHEELLKQGTDQIMSLEKNLNKLRHQAKVNKTVLEEQIRKKKELTEELSLLDAEADARLQEKEEAIQELHALSRDVLKEKDALESQEKAIQDRLSELEKAETMFKERLGFRFQKISGGRLQMIFTCVDPKDPDAQFCFYVRIDEGGKYIVSDCVPCVDGVDELIEKLNATNNFRSFVIAIRKVFKASVTN